MGLEKFIPLGMATMIVISAGCSMYKPSDPPPTRKELVIQYCRDTYATQNKKFWDCLIQNDPSKYGEHDILREKGR